MRLLFLAAAVAAMDIDLVTKRMAALKQAGELRAQGLVSDEEFNKLKSQLMGQEAPVKAAVNRRSLAGKGTDGEKIAQAKCLASRVSKAVTVADECAKDMAESTAPAVTALYKYLIANGGAGGGVGEKAFDAIFCLTKEGKQGEKDTNGADKDDDDGKNSSTKGGCMMKRLTELEEDYVSKDDFEVIIKKMSLKYDKDGKLISTSPDGLTKDTAAKTCLDIYKAYKGFRSGTYYLKKGGADNGTPVKVHCDMGDYVNDRPGWTLVVKYGGDRNFNQGFNVGEYQAANLANRVTNNSGKFSDADIIRWQNLHSSRLLRYIGHKSSSEYYFFYTQNKDHCMDNAPSCSKKDCPGNNRYPMRWGKSNPGSNNRAYITGGWANNGGIYGGHDNHGNCHGGMNGCASSWIRGVGHICTWNNKGSAGLWFNYGTWTGGRYRGSTWILGGSLTDGL